MNGTVRILKAQDWRGSEIFDVVATSEPPVPDENPDLLIASYTNRLQALVAARRYDAARRASVCNAAVIPFSGRGRVA